MREPSTAKSPVLERALAVVTEVRAGEAVPALLLALNVCLVLTASLILKPVRDGLVLALDSGAEYKSYMGGAIAVALVFAVPAYARYADRVPKRRLVVSVTLFFALHLLLFFAAAQVPALEARLGLFFYLWHGIFNMMIVAQFWAFANDVYSDEQGRRLFPLVGIGQTLGAFAGSVLSVLLLRWFTTYTLMLVSAGFLVISAALVVAADKRFTQAPLVRAETGNEQSAVAAKPRGVAVASGAFRMVARDRYLTLIAAFSVLFTLVNTNGEFMLSKLLKESASTLVESGALLADDVKQHISRQYAQFYLAVNLLTLVLQSFVVSRVIRRGGVRAGLLVLPIIALGDAFAVAVLPVLAVLRVGKVLENASDYSFNNTARNMLWLPTSAEAKYKAKQAVDAFFVRFGDVSSALLVAVASGMLHLGVRAFALVNLVLIGGWLVLSLAIAREHARRSREKQEKLAAGSEKLAYPPH
jgi:ATP:ADP antiporter, AAA family